jgi:hypothetical protein
VPVVSSGSGVVRSRGHADPARVVDLLSAFFEVAHEHSEKLCADDALALFPACFVTEALRSAVSPGSLPE